MRFPDWKRRLRAAVAESERLPFVYGFNDCYQFIARCVAAMTGENYAARFAAYQSFGGAVRILRDYGTDLGGIAEALFGQALPANHCHEGDVVEADLDGRLTMGMCLGYVCAFAGDRRIIWRPRTVIKRGWRVP